MRPHRSSLNPYAESYIPLSRRNIGDINSAIQNFARTNIGAEFSGTHNQPHASPSISFNAHPDERAPMAAAAASKGRSFHGTLEIQISEEIEMLIDRDFDMECLRANFPRISDESLADVYFANNGDLDATIDMLTNLESYTHEPENLPDSLDIGDTSEPRYATVQPSFMDVGGDGSTSCS